MAKSKSKKRKIVRIENIVRSPSDFLTKTKTGFTEIRSKYANRKIDVPFEDTLSSRAKIKNICVTCHNYATKMVYLSINGGGLRLERYCPGCFDRLVDVDKMVIKPSDSDSYLENIMIKPSDGQSLPKEDWEDKIPNYKKWQRI